METDNRVTVLVLARWVHIVAASFWLGGLITLAVVAITARRTLDHDQFSRFMARAGRAFLTGSVVAWLALGLTGFVMAHAQLHGWGELQTTPWGRILGAKTALAIGVIVLAGVHSYAGGRTSSPAWIRTSRVLSPLIAALTLVIYYLAVRLTEG